MNMSNTTTFPYKLEKVATLSEHTERVWSCAWSPGGKYLLTTSSDCTARIWTCKDLPNTTDASSQDESAVVEASGSPGQTWTCVQVLSGVHTRTIRYGAWSPTGRYLALCSFDRSISIWEQEDGVFECVATLEGHQEGNEIKCVSWSPTGDMLASCARDKTVMLWGSEGPAEWECLSGLTGHTQDVKHVIFHPTQDVLLSSSYDSTVKLWQAEEDDWYCSATLTHHTDTVWALAFAPDAEHLATVSADRSLVVSVHKGSGHGGARSWPVASRAPDLHERPIYSVSWSRPVQLSAINNSFVTDSSTATELTALAAAVAVNALTASLGLIATAGGDDAIVVLAPMRVAIDELPMTAPMGDAPVPAAAAATAANTDSTATDGQTQQGSKEPVSPSPYSAAYHVDASSPRQFPNVLAETPAAATDSAAEGERDKTPVFSGRPTFASLVTVARLESAHKGEVNCVTWHPKRRNVLATASDDKTACIWRLVPNTNV